MNDTSLIFPPIFFSLVHGYMHSFLLCMNCPGMMSEDILYLVYMYLPENVQSLIILNINWHQMKHSEVSFYNPLLTF